MAATSYRLDPKTLAKFEAVFRRKNQAFKRLSLNKQRVQIAKDVIEQINARKLRVKANSGYFNWATIADKNGLIKLGEQVKAARAATQMLDDAPELKQFVKIDDKIKQVQLPQLALLTMQTSCEVCGIGGLFVAALERMNDFKAAPKDNNLMADLDLNDDASPHKDDAQIAYMTRWFDRDQLRLIEGYFEIGGGHGSQHLVHDHSPIVKQRSAPKRLIMIMENIISNGGTFDPTKGKYAVEF